MTQLANGRAVTRFVLRLERFVAVRGWCGDAQGDPPDWFSEPIVDFAIKSLNRLHRKLLRRGKGFGNQSPGERHALRIAAKHMRYAVEFFGSLFHPHSAAERYIDKAQALQDLLGQQNDATIALGLIKTLDFGADAEFAYAAGVAAGWCARSGGGEEPTLRKAWRSLRKAEPFWREAHANVEGA